MTIGFIFWLLMLLWLIFGLICRWPTYRGTEGYRFFGFDLFMFILLFLLGWRVFGFIVQG